MITLLYVVSFLIGLFATTALFLRLPDHDRSRAYPNQPEQWFGSNGASADRLRPRLRSAFFWALICTLTSLGGLITTGLGLSAPVGGALSLVVSLSAASYICARLLRHGPGMLQPMPRVRANPKNEKARARPRVLFVGGSLNQTTQMEKIAAQMPGVEAHFSPFFGAHWAWTFFRKLKLCEFAICGYRRRGQTLDYLTRAGLSIDLHGERHDYDLIVLPTDHLLSTADGQKTPTVVVQEGIVLPPDWRMMIWKYTRLMHRALCDTATLGQSHAYARLCVASEGYRRYFIEQGCDPKRLVVTGIPNFDDIAHHRQNDFPHKGYVLVCTSDARETALFSGRKAFLRKVAAIAGSRQLIFKMHPNENIERTSREIKAITPHALIYSSGSAEEMVANCETLITEWSSLTFVGAALGKEVISLHPLEKIHELLPVQNRCAATNIAQICRDVLRPAMASIPASPVNENTGIAQIGLSK